MIEERILPVIENHLVKIHSIVFNYVFFYNVCVRIPRIFRYRLRLLPFLPEIVNKIVGYSCKNKNLLPVQQMKMNFSIYVITFRWHRNVEVTQLRHIASPSTPNRSPQRTPPLRTVTMVKLKRLQTKF